MAETASLTIDLAVDQLQHLKALAKRCKRTPAELIALALRDYLPDLKERLARLTEERGHTVNFYREGWATRMPPHADAVLTKLVDQGFMIAVCAKPHCPD